MRHKALVAGCVTIVAALFGYGQAAVPHAQAPGTSAPGAPGAPGATQRALLDEYFVTSHNDRLKTPNF